MSTIISVENLSKKYIIGHQRKERYTALRDVLVESVRHGVNKLLHPFSEPDDVTHEEFWALKDISFDIQQGDRVGVIGRNGAGKSTLLKVLSRITEPTGGRVKINGRVASLLEVGTGFHPELTGRENIFLNGAILGMKRSEIYRKFDEIVEFAEVEQFLDTPVKRYSSGMYVRLAFAVAAHLEPEVLIVDEVLAVGDAQFQKKCLGKMRDVGTEGRTVILVSHNMAAISSLCTKGVVLSKGLLEFTGSVDDSISKYLAQSSISRSFTRPKKQANHSDADVEITDFKFFSQDNDDTVVCGKEARFEISYNASKPNLTIQFLVGIYDIYNTCILFLDSEALGLSSKGLPAVGKILGRLTNEFSLFPGVYTINVAAFIHGELVDHVPNALELVVQEGDFFGTGRWPRGKPLVLVKQDWSIEVDAK